MLKNNLFLKIIAGFFSFLLLLIILYFSLRGLVLQKLIEKAQAKFSNSYQMRLDVARADFSGLDAVVIQGMQLSAPGMEPLLVADSIYSRVSILPLLRRNIRIEDIAVYKARLTLIKNDSTSNFQTFFNQKDDSPADTTNLSTLHYGEVLDKLINAVFDRVPKSIRLHQVVADVRYKGDNLLFEMDSVLVQDNRLSASVLVSEASESQLLRADGKIYKKDRKANIKIYSDKQEQVMIPFLQSAYATVLGFDTLQLDLQDNNLQDGILKLNGFASVSNLLVYNEKLARDSVYVRDGSAQFNFNIGKSDFELDSTSSVKVNQVQLKPYFYFKRGLDQEAIFSILPSKFAAQDFFNSLPEGLFQTYAGIKATGELTYKLDFRIKFDEPDSLVFNSALSKKDFEIQSYGAVDYRKIRGPFVHNVIEHDRVLRTIVVGPNNPSFTSINNISPYLIHAVMNAEDGNFYGHRGFNEAAFRASIVTNFKEERFVRGGSTITMQLVKNVYLTRDKTISRKLEEALIVWLLENQKLVNKTRMLEVYFNIIEWGPNVYGIHEAAQFYFNKHPAALTLAESIFLASIVPRPKAFRYSFDTSGNLRRHLQGYYNLLSGIILRRGLISEEERSGLEAKVELAGRARDLIVVSDPADTLLVEPDFDLQVDFID